MKRAKRGREENIAMKEYIRSQKKNSDLSEGSNRVIPLNEEDSGAIHYFEFNEAVYFEAVVDMKEWI
jgi:hypothetical protein